jgi:transcriptional regulator with XRE-family HTH domain
VGANPSLRANPAERAELQAKAYELKLKGWSLRRIGAELNVSHTTIKNYINDEVEARTVPLLDEVVKIEIDRYDRYLARLEEAMDDEKADVAKLVASAVRVSEARRKLLGYDAPQRVEATVHQVSETDVELAEIVREATVRAALEEREVNERAS